MSLQLPLLQGPASGRAEHFVRSQWRRQVEASVRRMHYYTQCMLLPMAHTGLYTRHLHIPRLPGLLQRRGRHSWPGYALPCLCVTPAVHPVLAPQPHHVRSARASFVWPRQTRKVVWCYRRWAGASANPDADCHAWSCSHAESGARAGRTWYAAMNLATWSLFSKLRDTKECSAISSASQCDWDWAASPCGFVTVCAVDRRQGVRLLC